ncbi:hypothetical protein [Wenyingzhuangia aestuarii]|uniref:hypothetical protein n=1 Tax=Wenyingzhuangia aestuarii TaxID=1647582 RepID=UPI001438893D|nr:hypothetical protein [Wenyingzhuangia aestuarii]NJB81968.1 hypothetical protein [Wenyingzhuangia aestuarii]
MIQYVQRKNIDIDKYDACIQNASNSRIYALSCYLDIVANHWDALILNDYEAVMPLPWKSKYFIKYIYPPCWTQQLGVFSLHKITPNLVQNFIKAIPRKFLKTTIQFNSECIIETQIKNNYILALNRDYSFLKTGYNKNRKRILSKINTTNNVTIFNDSLDNFTSFFNQIDHNFSIQQKEKNKLFKLIKKLIDLNKGQIISVKIDKKTEATVFITLHKNRITNLVPMATKKGKKRNLPTILIDYIIQYHQNTNMILDFEGSMIPGVAQFYKSFGSELEQYFLYSKKIT